ncbi:MAG: hypothetical protein O7C74_01535 [Acidobacteria bacterium]|nr:hypothetical protein [Acidobacteriota bacterium]
MVARCAAIVLLALLPGACAPSSPQDEPDRVMRTFCTLYFEKADLMAALPWVAGAARNVLLEEMRHLPTGAAATPRPQVRWTVVRRQEMSTTQAVRYRVEVRLSPLPGAAADSVAWVLPFTLLLENTSGKGLPAWRVTAVDQG